MWAILKFDKKNLLNLKQDLKKKLGEDVSIYSPKLCIQKYKRNKIVKKEFDLLGDYLFCYHKKFENPLTINSLKFTKGLKYFLNGFIESQLEIKQFIEKCKQSEDSKGYLNQNFFEINTALDYKFSSGPFVEKIFKIVKCQKNKIDILLGNIRTTINKNKFLFTPL
tara:strand:+ start:29 stop:526 length:498 start_codon:yes stop_codon:yes gene_type:complete